MKEVRMMDVPIIDFMSRMTNIHTQAWKGDLDIDITILNEIREEQDLRKCELPNAFFWISRLHGTNLIPEHKAFFDKTSANEVLSYYLQEAKHSIRLFLIEPDEIEKDDRGTLYGSVCELDPQETLQFLIRNSLQYESRDDAIEASCRLDYALTEYKSLHERFSYAEAVPKDIRETYIQVREKHRLINEKRNRLPVVNYEDFLSAAERAASAPKKEQKARGR